ncbi:MAG TPA: CHAT domain-containing protein [Thermoanaerobaculia bacterium]|nr:CHAT domain-containing protein [Thermoanaerobaculia bacterium]
MTANTKFGWRVGIAAVAVTVSVLTSSAFLANRQKTRRVAPDFARWSPSKNRILELDAAQKAWMRQPTPATAWRRATVLEALAGAGVAASAWDDYLRLDSTSPLAEEARRRRRQKVVTVTPNPAVDTERVLAAWARAVLGGRAEDEKRALASLAAHGKAQQLETGDAFLVDVAVWAESSGNDGGRKRKAADAIQSLQAGRQAFAVRDLAAAEPHLRRAEGRLRQMRSPLATVAAIHLAGVLYSRAHFDRAADVLLANVEACAPERRYVVACGSQKWSEGLLELQQGRASEALNRFDRALKELERSGDVARYARLLFVRAATLDTMRATDEAWADRVKAMQRRSRNGQRDDRLLAMLAIAAARDGYYYAGDHLLSQVQRGSNEHLARWRAFTQSRIAGELSDPNLHLAHDGIIASDGAFIQAKASFTSYRRNEVMVSLQGQGVVSTAPRSDWSEPVDEFVPEHIQREAIGVMVADSVRRLYEHESRVEVANGSAEAALWMSDRARAVGVPSKETRACVHEQGNATAAEMGRMLVACVPQGVAFVHQDLDATRLYTWVIRGGRAQLVTTWVSAPQLAADITHFHDAIADKTSTAALLRQAQYLYDILLRPVQTQIAGTDLLVYSPSPNLRGLPIAALHDGTRFLIETRPIVKTPTISTFTLTAAARRDSSALVVLPDAALQWRTLAGAGAEVQMVSRIYDGRAALLTKRAATPEAFLNSAAAHDIIHVATHGQTSVGPYQNSIEFGQERIRAYDIFSLRLKRKPIVMLAACRTADSSGGPMNIGLTDAFLAAGASAVVGSLWDVEDRSTGQLSVGFHRELARGAAPHDALRRVQLQFIRQGRPLSTWAAFQVSS